MRLAAAFVILCVACNGKGVPDASVSDAARADAPAFDAAVDAALSVDGGPADAGVDATLARWCQATRDAWRAIAIQLDRSCDAATDCTLVGGTQAFSCDCHTILVDFHGPLSGDCNGVAVNAAAAAAVRDELEPLSTAFNESCSREFSLPALCDCPPTPEVSCASGACGMRNTGSCFFFPDAGM